MSRRTAACLALLASLLVITGCAAERVYGPGGKVAQLPASLFEALEKPEVLLQTRDEAGVRTGKITGLENRTVRFLPAPYWNVETQRIDLASISRISVPAKPRSVVRAGLSGFGWGFLTAGGLLAALSRYDEDYQYSLIYTPAAAATIGLVAMGVTAISGAGKEKRYEMDSMSDEEKAFVILKLMKVRR